ncbi:WD40/YVTN/BNR-like repeat-containing protein [Kaistella polysaccharea]|uniref:WD40/YVTN/BNR-like repeat-containing protein n=1 Tax=Kaistella polysaccharea TaxID=2878534 RepID=UPI001CF3B665|nr:glycosyl hydrolase [Kaistella polysaccharea]
MKRFLLFNFFLLSFWNFAQKIEIQTLLKDNISIRALQIDDGKVWYSGTESKFGFVSLSDSADKKQMRLSEKNLQFRTLAQNNTDFYAINIESPAYFFKINKSTLQSEIMHTDSSKNAFYDALYFHRKYFYAFSDPEDNLKLKFARFSDCKNFKIKFLDKELLELKKGEAAFAASNTNIASSKKNMWVATGGMASRIIKINLRTGKMKLIDTPFIQGTSSQGIYSIDFYNENFGIAVGGDYTKQAENINNIATTIDGGKTWQIQASGKNGGYKTCVKFRPRSKGKDIIAVGDQNIEFSNDYGKTWKTISEEQGLYVCDWVDENTLVFAGKNRIIKMKIDTTFL